MNTFNEVVSAWLGLGLEPKDLTFLHVSLRGVIIILMALIMIRMGDRRALSEKSPFDAVLIVILASVLSRAINGTAGFFTTIGGSFVLVILHRLLAVFACASPAFRRLVKGRARELVRDGKLIPAALRKHQITEDDIMEDLRLNAKVEELEKIRIARLESSGDLSFIKFKEAE
jgi:uncharacterized membrane protein YcaP (DUF421 family)